jgi:tRNA(Ile)-lysidine synthetase-like protein
MPASLLEGAYVSSRCEGDVMIPFGRKTPVKLKKLMIDAHVERAMRQSVPILRDCKGNVLMAVGLRASENCRVSKNEKQMMVRYLGEWIPTNRE